MPQHQKQWIYQGMVVPIITYCAVDIIISNTYHELRIKTPLSINQIKACRLARRCMDGNVCSNFNNYFVKRDHNMATQNNGYQLELTNIQLEYSRGSLFLNFL